MTIEDLKEKIKDKFGKNLISILQYGSSLYNENSATDLDLIVILESKEHALQNLTILKELNNQAKDLNLDLQLLYSEEIFSPNHFSLDAHGSYFLLVLKKAKVLYGTNPFQNITHPTNDEVSIIHQIQNYVFRSRQEAMGIPKNYKDQNLYYHRKKIKNIMNDMLFMQGKDIGASFEASLKMFQSTFNILSKKDLIRLKNAKTKDVEAYIYFYEKLYSYCIEIIKDNLKELKILRYRQGNIVSEVCNSKLNTKKAIILIDGIPSVPKRKKLMQLLAKQGFAVFFPRLRGTWESSGSFLSKSPVKDMDLFLESLTKGIKIKDQKHKYDEFYVLSTSFGGGISMALKNSHIVKRVHLSPVIDFRAISDVLSSLQKYLQNMFPGAYRFKPKDWIKLSDGTYFDSKEQNLLKTKDLILAGELDKTLDVKKIVSHANKNSIKVLTYSNLGHMNFSDLERRKDIFYTVINFFKTSMS